MTTKLTCMLFCVLFSMPLLAQPSQQEIDTQMVLAQDYMRQKNFDQARPALHWLLTNVPEYKASVYIMAYKAYEKVAQSSKSTDRKAVLLDSMMTVYRLKERHFGLSDLELNNLAFRYYKYYRKDKSRYIAALEVFSQVFEKPENVILNNLPAYMSMIRMYNATVKQMPAKELMNLRATIGKAETAQRQSGTTAEKLKKFTDVVDQLFYETIKPTLNCEVIEELSTDEKLAELTFARMIFAWSLDFSCTTSDFFVKAAETIANDPEGKNPGILILLAKKAAADGRYEEAISKYEEALLLQTDNSKKAGTFMDMARVHALTENKSEARKAAYKAAELDENRLSGSLSFIANLYMASFDQCAEGHSITDDRAVFMAAYDLFQKAGDTAGMQVARAQFPTVSQAHTENYQDGDIIDIGCWMNVKTKVKTRPSQ